MRIASVFLTSAIFMAVSIASVTAVAQTLPLVGRLGGGGKQIPANTSVVVVVTPNSGHFVLTQACVGPYGAELSGSTVGFIAYLGGFTGFVTGFPLPPREKLICTAGDGASNCSATWVIEKN